MCKHALSTWDLMQPAVQYDTTARSKCRHCRTDQPYLQIKMPHRHRRWLVLRILCSAHDRPLQRQHLVCPGWWLMTSCTSVRVSMCEDPCCRQQHALGLRSMVRTQHPGDRDVTPSSAAVQRHCSVCTLQFLAWSEQRSFPAPTERPLPVRRVQQFQQKVVIDTCAWLGIGLPSALSRQQRQHHILSSLQ